MKNYESLKENNLIKDDCKTKALSRIKEMALDFLDTFSDQFEDEIYTEEYVKKMSDKKALNFVLDEIDNAVAGDGLAYLFTIEWEAIKELKVWARYGLTEKDVDEQIKYKNKNY